MAPSEILEAIAQAEKRQYKQTLEDAKEQANMVLMFPEDKHLLLERKEGTQPTNKPHECEIRMNAVAGAESK